MTTGDQHPDYVHRVELPYMIDGTADTAAVDDPQKCALCPLLWIFLGTLTGAAIFALGFISGRWSA